MDGYNVDITDEQKQRLREIFPEVFTEDKIDFDRLRASLGSNIELGERYGLNWKGKSDVFATIQERTTSTLHPQREESVDWDTTQNMFIEGDNLEALKVLHKAYYGKIKMIYIDPPYNTGNDFVYNDDFAKSRRQHAIDEGVVDDEGNVTRDDGLRVNTGGHKHSNWLDMMYPRLFLARNLLRQDGVIFVSIDDNEVHNLRLMMNEIFGEENFIAQVTAVLNPRGRNLDVHFAKTHEYVLVYGRDAAQEGVLNKLAKGDDMLSEYTHEDDKDKYRLLELRNRNPAFNPQTRPNLYYPIYVNPSDLSLSLDGRGGDVEVLPHDSAGGYTCWTWSKQKFEDNLGILVAKQTNDGSWRIYRKDYLHDENGNTATTLPKTVWQEKELNHDYGKKSIKELFEANVMSFPKSVGLMKKMIELGSYKDSIVMDFFSGSGTFAQAVYEVNSVPDSRRQWICVQLPEQVPESSEASKAGYITIANIGRERIRRAGAKISSELAEKGVHNDFGYRSYKLDGSNFKKWNELTSSPEELKQQTFSNLNPLEDDVTDDEILTEILLKHGISPLVTIENYDDFVFIPSEFLVISLAREMTEELFAEILAKSPTKIILLDDAFKDSINLKTNLILQAEKQSIAVEVM